MGMSKGRPGLEIQRDQFLAGLGSLGDVKIQKLGDRIGLAFSQTTPIAELSEAQIIAIPGEWGLLRRTGTPI